MSGGLDSNGLSVYFTADVSCVRLLDVELGILESVTNLRIYL